MSDDKKSLVESKPESGTSFFNSIKNLGTAIVDVGTSAVESASAKLDQSDAGRKAKEIGNKAADMGGKLLDEASVTAKKIGSNLSGEESQIRIEALIEQQRRYNDIIATRLAEALDRIEKLEGQVEKLTRER
jgi:hypothetical protein